MHISKDTDFLRILHRNFEEVFLNQRSKLFKKTYMALPY